MAPSQPLTIMILFKEALLARGLARRLRWYVVLPLYPAAYARTWVGDDAVTRRYREGAVGMIEAAAWCGNTGSVKQTAQQRQ